MQLRQLLHYREESLTVIIETLTVSIKVLTVKNEVATQKHAQNTLKYPEKWLLNAIRNCFAGN